MSTERFELIAPCHFGLEAVLKREILDLVKTVWFRSLPLVPWQPAVLSVM